ncbi:hypothetical protein M427DRAFT_486926 [Gonapodya prolifera JEL478]|uniref:UEV domain-containing protein n=1 Tax=Gonapodya prolifera (strain JEL478) TaxID=1344416 RepID=A0A139AR98_GONPJ|nr:hypothetical protein M427DRAFT_486926 [Gonapodya prolifera JEL478]|eukprot:KXS19015.1 hypothetical protein M427DRAFT_486926 [Gonapodya prolifera JEL478]
MAQKVAWVRSASGRYGGSRDRVSADIEGAMRIFPHLQPSLEKPLPPPDPNAGFEMIKLEGTIPVFWRVASYNIPIVLYVPPNYPASPPRIRVRPTQDMQIKIGQAVPYESGEVVLPYLQHWASQREPPTPYPPSSSRSDAAPPPIPPQSTPIAEALRLAKAAFEVQMPVYQRKAGTAQQQNQQRPAGPPRPPPPENPPPVFSYPRPEGPSYPRPDPSGGGAITAPPLPPPRPSPSPFLPQVSYPRPDLPSYPVPAPPLGAPQHPSNVSGYDLYPTPPPPFYNRPAPPLPSGAQDGNGSGRDSAPTSPRMDPRHGAFGQPAPPPRRPLPGDPSLGQSDPVARRPVPPPPNGPSSSGGAGPAPIPLPSASSPEDRARHLRKIVADMVGRRAEVVLKQGDMMARQSWVLKQEMDKVEEKIRAINDIEARALSNVNTLRSTLTPLSHLLASLSALPVDPDDVVLVPTPLHAQAVDLVAEDWALEDAMVQAQSAVGKVDGGIGVVLKKIRELAKEQFDVRGTWAVCPVF